MEDRCQEWSHLDDPDAFTSQVSQRCLSLHSCLCSWPSCLVLELWCSLVRLTALHWACYSAVNVKCWVREAHILCSTSRVCSAISNLYGVMSCQGWQMGTWGRIQSEETSMCHWHNHRGRSKVLPCLEESSASIVDIQERDAKMWNSLPQITSLYDKPRVWPLTSRGPQSYTVSSFPFHWQSWADEDH